MRTLESVVEGGESMINKAEDQSWLEEAWGKRCKQCKQHATSPPQRDIRCWLLKSSYVEASIIHLLFRLSGWWSFLPAVFL